MRRVSSYVMSSGTLIVISPPHVHSEDDCSNRSIDRGCRRRLMQCFNSLGDRLCVGSRWNSEPIRWWLARRQSRPTRALSKCECLFCRVLDHESLGRSRVVWASGTIASARIISTMTLMGEEKREHLNIQWRCWSPTFAYPVSSESTNVRDLKLKLLSSLLTRPNFERSRSWDDYIADYPATLLLGAVISPLLFNVTW